MMNAFATHRIDLNGIWKFKTDPNKIGELYPDDVIIAYKDDTRFMEIDYDAANWDSIKVPSCWQQEGYTFNGAAWYRRSFILDIDNDKSAIILKFDGVDYFCDAWLNGHYLGSHEGYFNGFSFDITKWIRTENIITVRVDSPNDTNLLVPGKKNKSLIKGAIQDFDANNLDINPSGIWNDVYLEIVPHIYITDLKIDTILNKTYDAADLIIKATILNKDQLIRTISVITEASPQNFSGSSHSSATTLTIVPGLNSVCVIMHIENPKIWWTWDYGEPNLYAISVSLHNIGGLKEQLHNMKVVSGIREIRKGKGWEVFLNGQRIFFRGANYLSDQILALMDESRYKQDVMMARNANMNMLRVFCNVEKDFFYRECDAAGILVYQDMPLQWEMSNDSDLVRRATVQARDMINLLYNHPCIIIWCFGSEPGKKNFEKLGMALVQEAAKIDSFRIIHQANSWVKQWPFREFSQIFEWSIDNHFYPGWYNDPWKDIFDICSMPLFELELVSEFGAQSLPCQSSLEKIVGKDNIWPPNWKIYQKHCFQKVQQFSWIRLPDNLLQFIALSQDYQAFILKYIIEYLRCKKFKPCNGALMFLFNDCSPAITWSVIDYYRTPKKAYNIIKNSFDPIIIAMEWPKADITGRVQSSKVIIVNDTRQQIRNISITLTVLDSFGTELYRNQWYTDVDENSVYTSQEISLGKVEMSNIIKLEMQAQGNILRKNRYRPLPFGDFSADWFVECSPIIHEEENQ